MTTYPPPAWLTGLADRLPTLDREAFSRFRPPPEGGERHSAVLMLFAPGDAEPEDTTVVITERSHSMRRHAGQPAFPGGGTEPGDADAVHTALREAWEEIGLESSGVEVLGQLPTLHLSVSGYDVTPVLAWWRRPAPETLWAKDPREVARVLRPSVASLVAPEARFQVRHPSGFVGPAWDVEGLLVWGFTGGILDRVLDLGGVAQPWDRGRTRELRL
ncbi:NUDIX hydrolase [Ornithinimicrobium tianjinense]|uniref:Coenzyme A pyrophosphatase n=1 Tax=Ornithinimicrobium tianjinense TaxID=1195761 RepID=A0A917F074_9MICO|nr:CoA pyrophosphatase [Ornithinimicrobium tianjinense]GGF37446.1 coenzyme A pyrophosphatase [Ornithinimicrobium tianjinense]